MSVSYLIYLIVGKLLIFLGGKFVRDNEIGNRFIRNLFSCELCLGVWIFTIISFLLGEQLFEEYFFVPFLSQLVTGGISSLLVHLVSVGYKEQFLTINIE